MNGHPKPTVKSKISQCQAILCTREVFVEKERENRVSLSAKNTEQLSVLLAILSVTILPWNLCEKRAQVVLRFSCGCVRTIIFFFSYSRILVTLKLRPLCFQKVTEVTVKHCCRYVESGNNVESVTIF